MISQQFVVNDLIVGVIRTDNDIITRSRAGLHIIILQDSQMSSRDGDWWMDGTNIFSGWLSVWCWWGWNYCFCLLLYYQVVYKQDIKCIRIRNIQKRFMIDGKYALRSVWYIGYGRKLYCYYSIFTTIPQKLKNMHFSHILFCTVYKVLDTKSNENFE